MKLRDHLAALNGDVKDAGLSFGMAGVRVDFECPVLDLDTSVSHGCSESVRIDTDQVEWHLM